MLSRREFMAAAAGVAATPILPAAAAPPQILRIAMTAADVPTPTGIPNNGFEGYRFMGYTAYDGLVNWDLLHNQDKPARYHAGPFHRVALRTRKRSSARSLPCARASSFTTVRISTPMP